MVAGRLELQLGRGGQGVRRELGLEVRGDEPHRRGGRVQGLQAAPPRVAQLDMPELGPWHHDVSWFGGGLKILKQEVLSAFYLFKDLLILNKSKLIFFMILRK